MSHPGLRRFQLFGTVVTQRVSMMRERASPLYDSLMRRAFGVVNLRFGTPTVAAHLAAARHMLERADQLVAVWNGQVDDAAGGPVDVIREALWRRIPVKVIWPPG